MAAMLCIFLAGGVFFGLFANSLLRSSPKSAVEIAYAVISLLAALLCGTLLVADPVYRWQKANKRVAAFHKQDRMQSLVSALIELERKLPSAKYIKVEELVEKVLKSAKWAIIYGNKVADVIKVIDAGKFPQLKSAELNFVIQRTLDSETALWIEVLCMTYNYKGVKTKRAMLWSIVV